MVGDLGHMAEDCWAAAPENDVLDAGKAGAGWGGGGRVGLYV